MLAKLVSTPETRSSKEPVPVRGPIRLDAEMWRSRRTNRDGSFPQEAASLASCINKHRFARRLIAAEKSVETSFPRAFAPPRVPEKTSILSLEMHNQIELIVIIIGENHHQTSTNQPNNV